MPKFYLIGILVHKSLVNKYDKELTEKIMEDLNSVDILVLKYLRKATKEKIFLPDSFTLAKKEELVQKYIESDLAHIN